MPKRTVFLGLIIVALAACGKEPLPQKPQLLVDRDSIGFSQEFGSGTFVGAKPQESLLITNGGLENLVINSVSLTGDSQFSVDGPSPCLNTDGGVPCEVKGKGRTFIRIIFAPTQERNYSASITINSNAENAPTKVVGVTGRGIAPNADGGQ